MSDEHEDDDTLLLRAALALVSDRWQNIRIFVNRIAPDGATESESIGAGNTLAQMGHIETWMKCAHHKRLYDFEKALDEEDEADDEQ